MRAARYYGPRDVRIETIADPVPAPNQVLIEVELCGICGTDLHEFYDGPVFCPTADTAHPLTGETAPVVLGHEFVGVVRTTGAAVTDLVAGDRVVVEPRTSCGQCAACESGRYNCCPRAATIGLQGGGGGLAELIAVDRSLVFPIGGLSADLGAVVEPLAVAVHAVAQAGADPAARSAVVFGAGPIGLLIVWVLKSRGVSTVTVVEPSSTRRDRARVFGADRVIDPIAQRDPSAQVRAGGEGVDLAFECAGRESALQACLESVRPGATVVNVAIAGRPLTVDLLPLIVKEIKLVGTICYANDHNEAIELLRGAEFPIAEFVTGRIGLDELVDGGIRALAENADAHVKILVSPSGTA